MAARAKPAVKKKSSRVRRIAQERIEILVNQARREQNTELADLQAAVAKKIAMRVRVRIPYDQRQLFCKKCKKLIVPGRTSRVRIGRANTRAVRITCLRCGHIYRKLVGKGVVAQTVAKDQQTAK